MGSIWLYQGKKQEKNEYFLKKESASNAKFEAPNMLGFVFTIF